MPELLVEHYGELNGGVLLDADMDDAAAAEESRVLWVSPVQSTYGWAAWCRDEAWGSLETQTRWLLALGTAARILTIDGQADLAHVVRRYTHTRIPYLTTRPQLDWRRIAGDFDAVHLTASGHAATRLTTPGTYSWDCESLAIFHAARVCRVVSVERPAEVSTDA